MDLLFKNAYVFENGKFKRKDLFIADGRVSDSLRGMPPVGDAVTVESDNCLIVPGLIDVHVHLREPGFSYKETIGTGTMAAAHGGYTTVCSMPNLSPAPDTAANLSLQLETIASSAVVNVLPYGTITMGQEGTDLSDMAAMAPFVAGFSDDGKGVQRDGVMRRAMLKARELGKIIAAHCEDNSLINGGYIHDGEYARLHKHRGISSESEWRQIERDIGLVRETGCKYHVCHVSAKESVDLIRKAKSEGLDVSCETAPHYLLLNDMQLKEDGRFRINPPIRSEEDRLALIEGLKDGTIELIATDHAPHTAEEKSGGLEKSLPGAVGLETAFPILYTKLVKAGIISLEKLVELMSVNPGRRFGLGGGLKAGAPADLAVFRLDGSYKIDPGSFFSKGRSTPFAGETVFGRCIITMVKGKIVWETK